MNQNRRDLLKFFGVGASIVPIIGGAPVVAAQAVLMETPKIEPASSIQASHPQSWTLDEMTGRLMKDKDDYLILQTPYYQHFITSVAGSWLLHARMYDRIRHSEHSMPHTHWVLAIHSPHDTTL